MQTGFGQSLIKLLQDGADATGLGLLAVLLAVSAWTCLRQGRPSGGQKHGTYLLLCAFAAPLLMFASLACGLALAQEAQSLPMASALWKQYRTLTWLLNGLVGLQQLYALQRLAYWPAAQPRRVLPLAAGAMLLPLAMALGLLALDRACLQQAGMPAMAKALAALSSIGGILLWLPAQLMTVRNERHHRNEPMLTPGQDNDMLPQSAAQADVLPTALSTAQEIEMRLGEIAQLLEQEQTQQTEAEHASQRALLQEHEEIQASTMQQQVNEQKFLFESGLPCKLGMLVNGLIILDQPLDLRDHVRGDSLLHAALREGNNALAQQLVENGVDIAAVNWAGVSARACTQDAAMRELLDTVARLQK
jgi:DNA-binding transcriptional MerR regulator